MEHETQITALVSRTTQELPADIIIHPKLVVTRRSGAAILKQIEKGRPSAALRRLMRDGR